MDDALETRLRQMAEENGIDPDELIALAGDAPLPEGLNAVVAAVLDDVATFTRALDRLKEEP